MPHPTANESPSRLPMWLRVREYAVPPSMIDTATARRAVGDWAGACAAARIDVDLRLRDVRARHGTALASRVRTDLRRLAPDLLRWHMPRIAPDGLLRPGLTVTLARYPRAAGPPLHLVVRTPPAWADAGQRMSLALWVGSATGAGLHPHPHPDRRHRLDLHRHLWDASRAGELARRHAPSDVAGPSWPVRWAAEAELLLRAEGLPLGPFAVRTGSREHAVLELTAPDDAHVPTLRLHPEVLAPQTIAALPLLPEAAARPLPDLELLRAGLITPERLHPLVAEALGAYARPGADAADEGTRDPLRVECLGGVHRIALRDGLLAAVDHPPEQLRREALLAALGGPPLPCLRAIDAVHREPEALPAVRERIAHGDLVGALDVLEALLGPRAVLRDGPLRDALYDALARRADHGRYRAGLVPPEGRALDGPETGRRYRPPRPSHMRRKQDRLGRPRTAQHR